VQSLVSRLVDLRKGEWKFAFPAFATLFLTVAAHTTLETARDAIFLTRFPTRDLNLVYVALAGITLVTTFVSTKLTIAVGRRRALVWSLLGVSVLSALFSLFHPTRKIALGLYLFSGVEGAMLVPQFWLLADDLFTLSQARRLFGSITSGGVLGGVAGAGSAALIVRTFPITTLLPVTAVLFLAAAMVTAGVRVEPSEEERASQLAPPIAADKQESRGALFRQNPFLFRIAALVSLSTGAVLAVDYLFKLSATRAIAPESLGFFFARYYAAMNAVSLVIQVFVAGRLIRRVGVIGASAVTPSLLLAAAAAVTLQGGFAMVLLLKTFDGGLRYSVHRVATELLYLPVPARSRQRIKGFIDSALSRIVQAVTAIGLYALAAYSLATPRLLALGIAVMCAMWFAVAVTLRGSYLDLFRGALASGGIDPGLDLEDIDLTSAGALVEAMASPDPLTVVAAMDVLAEHRRTALIPALILYHDAPPVLTRALELFSQSARTDWIPLAKRLIANPDESVSAAAVRTLARAGKLDALEKAGEHPSPRVEAYVAFFRAQHESTGNLLEHPLVAEVMRAEGDSGKALRRALLAAVSDSPDSRTIELLLALGELPELDDDEASIEQLAGAMAALKSERFVPLCLARIAKRTGRDAVRDALVEIGSPALDALEALLRDENQEHHRRLHAPRSISRFGTQRAADILLAQLLREVHGMVRYKILRALGQLVANHDVKVKRETVNDLATKNLEEHLRLLSLRVALGAEPKREGGEAAENAKQVLFGLLDDKLRQSMERGFRLLQLAHKHEDIETVHGAARSSEKMARANAGEFLDVLLLESDEQKLRRLLRIVVDDASDAERVERARELVPGLARTYTQALTMLLAERDIVLVALAAQNALGQKDEALRRAVAGLCARSPSLEATTELLFGKPLDVIMEEAHG
jgi:AAA family ATP:ADP antiporter